MPRPRLSLAAAAVFVLALALLELRGAGAPSLPAHSAFGHGPTVVLVHGLGSREEHWLPVARRLATHCRVVLVELPGHGSSGMPLPFSLEGATESLERALVAESPDEPVVLVGHSVGGLVAASVALDEPRRVRGLVLVETMLKPQVTAEERHGILHGLETHYLDVLHAAYRSFGRDSAQGERLFREAATEDSTNMKRWIRLAVTADLSRAVRHLAMPVLAVLAPNSWPPGEPWSVTAAATGYAQVPEVEPVRIEGSGHFVMLDQPAALARLIDRFIAQPMLEPVARR